jgi:hypothetical protein
MKRISKRLVVSLAITAAAIVLAPVALASTSAGAAAQHPAVTPPACGNAHPALRDGAFVWATQPGDGFAGGVGYVMDITNESSHACSLRGIPGAAVQASGHLIGGKIPASGNGPLVILKPGATAHFALAIHNAGAVCAHPVSGTVVIYLPGQRQGQSGWLDARACPGKSGGGVLGPGPIRAGVGVPLYST